ncbi:hypothetical protein TNCV_2896901 [Trichonephila clavipes]|nr:hypothetical protein TNCV_2896901 [Trichonephila clavipes]
MPCDAEECGFQMLNDDGIVTSVQEESDPVDDETDEDENNFNNESAGIHQMLTRFLRHKGTELEGTGDQDNRLVKCYGEDHGPPGAVESTIMMILIKRI